MVHWWGAKVFKETLGENKPIKRKHHFQCTNRQLIVFWFEGWDVVAKVERKGRHYLTLSKDYTFYRDGRNCGNQQVPFRGCAETPLTHLSLYFCLAGCFVFFCKHCNNSFFFNAVTFFLGLLTYSWQIKIYIFKVCNGMVL